MKKKALLLATIIFSAIGFNAAAQQYYSKPFVDQLNNASKSLVGSGTGKDTVMTAKKLSEIYDLTKSIQENITKQIFSESVLPTQIDSFKLSQGQATPYRGTGLGIVRNYNHTATNQMMSIEASTDTSQFYSIRYYMNNSQTIAKGNPTITITPIKLNDGKYNGFVYQTQGYSFAQIILENAYIKVTTMDLKKGDKTITSLSPEGYKKLFKKYDLDKLNKATILK